MLDGSPYNGMNHMERFDKVNVSIRKYLWGDLSSCHGMTIHLGHITGSPNEGRVHINHHANTHRCHLILYLPFEHRSLRVGVKVVSQKMEAQSKLVSQL